MPAMEQSAHLGQQQVLSPQMRQSLEILQATAIELEQMVRKELETNPALEEEEPGPTDEENPDDGEEPEEEDPLAGLEEDWREFSGEARDSDAEARRSHFLEGVVPPDTLAQHLERQLGRSALDPVQRRVAALLIGNLDADGYLAASLEEVADEAGVETAEVVDVLRVVQALEPAGVAARSLQECLKLQLEREGRGGGLAARIVDGGLDLLGRKKFAELASLLGVTQDDVREAGAVIAGLNPKPGRVFSGEEARALVPDVVIERQGDGYSVSLARDSIPHLRISRACRDLLGSAAPEVRAYLREKIRGGKFLMRSIQQRQETILAIAGEIAARQRGFLDHGVAALVPLTMAQVASAVGVHETTVSRAIAGKTVATPQGVFEMKFFFTTGYRTAEGGEISNASVKDAIGALVRGEDPRRPLSDQQIMDRLREDGLPVARRTVAKYREALGFLPSHLRKSF